MYCGRQREPEGGKGLVRNQLSIGIVISDSGCGVTPDKLEAITIALEQAQALRSESAGSGTGLAVVERIVKQLAGRLRVESQIGVGTLFSFTLLTIARRYRSQFWHVEPNL